MEAGRQRQFRIHHCLGRGGYGEVYRATMVAPGGLSSDVAVKLLRVDVDPTGEAVRRLRDEGRLLSVVRRGDPAGLRPGAARRPHRPGHRARRGAGPRR
ncbi:MAG: hypothetical protein R3F59_28270 [Myxococcota bacterium]